jgi:hypothetical protein
MQRIFGWLFLLIAAGTAGFGAAAQDGMIGGVPQAAVEREMLVRFSRAYGMAKGALDEHGLKDNSNQGDAELLRNPEQLDQPLRDEVYEIMDQNRVEPEEWRLMFAQMDADPALRERIESLSTPFGY